MDFELLKQLSNADAIASNEEEVRNIIKNELVEYKDAFTFDGIGSLLVSKKSEKDNAPTIVFAAHMDEVGFMVRYISPIGFVYLMPLGNVEDRAKIMQMIRITTGDGSKVKGLLNVTRDEKGKIDQMYVDLGFDSRDAVLNAGIDVGNMVCFDSEYQEMSANNVVAGKAMDDRAGCWSLIQVMHEIKDWNLDFNVVAAFTSSEEVGTRGGKLVANKIYPSLFFAIDVAKNPELDRGFMNTRSLGKGPMIEFFDRTMVPNFKLLQKITLIADEAKIGYQKDMFKGGGTDAGLAHLQHDGIAALVLGLPLRYCHDPYSLANKKDLAGMKDLIEQIINNISEKDLEEIYKF